MAANKTQPIIVIKRKGGHSGHHGGAWKVAYADFVTAMMSLFIVLWLMGSSEKVKKAVAGYFNDPKGMSSQLGTVLTGSGPAIAQLDTKDLEKLKPRSGTSSPQALRLRKRFDEIVAMDFFVSKRRSEVRAALCLTEQRRNARRPLV